MNRSVVTRLRATAATIALATLMTLPAMVSAQTPAGLPTAPGAGEKSVQGGLTAARASLVGENGSALEPYLFLAILAGGGIIAWGAALFTDNQLRRQR